jgi:Ran GTPase-activating protein (RanGAP) involved in mRNA processing and transport
MVAFAPPISAKQPDLTGSLPVNVSGMNVIKLPGCNLDAGCARNLAKSISENRSLALVYLQSNPLGDLGVEIISQAITKKLSLEALHLSDVGMTSKGLETVANVITTLRKLATLDLNLNPLGDVGIIQLSQSIMGKNSLSTLGLHSIGMTSKGMHELAQAIATLRNLTVLDIRFNAIGDEGVRTLSKSLEGSKVTNLYLTNVGMTDSSMPSFRDALMKMPCLADLVIHGAQLTEEGFANLREGLEGKSLRILHFTSTPAAAVMFTSEPPAGVSQNVGYIINSTPPLDVSRMSSLNLSGCGITEKCFPALTRLSTSIQELVLDYNPLGDIGVGLLAETLKNKAIKSLFLRGVGLTSVGMPALNETISSLGLPGTCAGLDLRENEIGDEGIICLSGALHSGSKIHALLLSKTGMTDTSMPELCSALSKMPHLNNLQIDRNDIVTEESFLWLRDGLSGKKMVNLQFDLCKESSVLFRDYEAPELETVSEPGSSSDE